MTNLQNIVKSLGIFVFRKCFAADHQSGVLEVLLSNSRRTPLWPKMWPISTTLSQAFFIHRFPLVYLRVSCKPQSGVFTKKFLLNQITTEKMVSQKNIVTSLRIIVHCYFYSAHHQNDTLKQLPRDCHLTLFRPRRLQISKILSHASELSLLSSYLMLSIIVTFWSFYGEILAEPYYCPKDNQFPKHCQTPHNNLSQLVFLACHHSVNLQLLR